MASVTRSRCAQENRRRLLTALAGGIGLAALRLPAAERNMRHVCLYYSEALGGYGFPRGHPLGADRQGAFFREASAQGLDKLVEIRTAPRWH